MKMPFETTEPLITDFGQELLDLMNAGARTPVRVEMPNRSAAVSLRYRIYHCRKRIRQLKRQELMHCTKVQARIEPDPAEIRERERNGEVYRGGWVVVVSPPDQHLAPFIKQALGKLPHLETDGVEAPDLSFGIEGQPEVDTLPTGAGHPPREVDAKISEKAISQMDEPLDGEEVEKTS
jgi:hypothetical protein